MTDRDRYLNPELFDVHSHHMTDTFTPADTERVNTLVKHSEETMIKQSLLLSRSNNLESILSSFFSREPSPIDDDIGRRDLVVMVTGKTNNQILMWDGSGKSVIVAILTS